MLNAVRVCCIAGLSVAGTLSFGAISSGAIAAVATFDSLSEGTAGTTLTDGGITFFDLDQRLADTIPSFSIESAAPELFDSSFSAPNYLSFGSFAEGEEFGFGRFGSTRIAAGTPGTAASLDLFSLLFSPSSNALTLEALLGETVVASTSVALSAFEPIGEDGLVRQTVAIADVTFDQLRLIASGPDDDGVVFIGLDNVRIEETTSVPEPASVASILAIGALLIGIRRR
ncbi:MAG: PEP-CTERM sorting domain-containing protein [Leptolyngbyaceae cyanobacterium RM1_406_9]|nr:PEP-CTERM sorting domain-containing protein [Leptolyngbyaceae cyanobacterium RM1_406_9]